MEMLWLPPALWIILWVLSAWYISSRTASEAISIVGGLVISTAVVSFLFLAIDLWVSSEQEKIARDAGFATFEQYIVAAQAGYPTKPAYDEYIAWRRQQKQAAEKRSAAKEAAEKEKDRKIAAAVREEKRKAKEEDCKKSLECWARRNYPSAAALCAKAVERLAKYDFDWTDEGLFVMKFSRHRWHKKDRLSITYFGDRIKFQNAFGAWRNYMYWCDYDTKKEIVLDASAQPGRFR